MPVFRFDAGPWSRATGWQTVGEKVLRSLLPEANPQIEAAYERVTHFWLEIDGSGQVVREVGFDRDGSPIVAGPLGRNMGIFTDIGDAPIDLGPEQDAGVFEQAWEQVNARFDPARPNAGLF